MTEKFDSIAQAFSYYGNLLVEQDKVMSKNPKNQETYKRSLREIHPVFFELTDPTMVMPNFKNYKVQPYWVTGEIVTEMLGLNPPLMTHYRPDLIEWSYNLLDSGRACYSYGGRWLNHNSIEKTVKQLQNNPTSKRLYVPIYDQNDVGDVDDAPCNLGFLLLSRNNKLDMTLFTRSIDINRGFKYDPALFSFIQQSLASTIGQEPGSLFYYCNSLHCYDNDIGQLEKSLDSIEKGKGKVDQLKVDSGIELRKLYDDMRSIVEIDTLSRHKQDYSKIELNYEISKQLANNLTKKNGL